MVSTLIITKVYINNYHCHPLSFMVKEWIPLNFWLRKLGCASFDSLMDQSAECPEFCGRMLYITMQTVKMRVSPLFFRGFPRHMDGLEDSIYDPFV